MYLERHYISVGNAVAAAGERGAPLYLRSGNGPEFVSRALPK